MSGAQGATLRQLRSWHSRLATAHARAVAVSEEAQAVLPEDSNALTIIMDPTIELHAALCLVERLIDARLQPKASDK